MLTLSFFGVLMFFCGLVSFSLKRKHLLMMLLSMEFVVISLYFLIFLYLGLFCNEYFFSMVFITFTVCEGVLGLAVLVSLIRTHGNDFTQGFSVLW